MCVCVIVAVVYITLEKLREPTVISRCSATELRNGYFLGHIQRGKPGGHNDQSPYEYLKALGPKSKNKTKNSRKTRKSENQTVLCF